MKFIRTLSKIHLIFISLCGTALAQTPLVNSRTALAQLPAYEAHEIDYIDNQFNVVRSEIHFLSTQNCQSALSGSYTH